jgi:tRNA(Ile)-lysidine synthase
MDIDSSVEKTFIETVRTRELLPKGSSVAAAVSGGADSVALLELLLRFRNHMRWSISILHVDHGARPESGSEADFVNNLAMESDIEFQLFSISPPESGSLEDHFSRERQRIYWELGDAGCIVATGHNADDRAETILMRLFEGAGLRGLGGMDYFGTGPVRRPLLDIGRGDLREYLRSVGREWVEDPSNEDTAYLRNRIRKQVIPVLESVHPGIRGALCRSSANLSQWRDVIDELICRSIDDIMSGGTFQRKLYSSRPRGLRLAILWDIAGRPRGGRIELEKTDRWIVSGKDGFHILPGGSKLVLEGERGRIEKESSSSEGRDVDR